MSRDRPAAGVGDSSLEGKFGSTIGGEILFEGTTTTPSANTPVSVSTGVQDQGAKEFNVGLASGFDASSSIITFEETTSLQTSPTGSHNTARYAPQFDGGAGEWEVVIEDAVGNLAVDIVVRDV